MSGTDSWQDRYSRQISLGDLNEEGQQKLGSSTVVVIGAGAVGSGTAETLARMGVGRLTIIDYRHVSESDLHRVRVLGEGHVGQPKALALAEALRDALPHVKVRGVTEEMTPENVTALISRNDVVIDGLDSTESRLVLNDACLELCLPWVMGRVVATKGMVATFPAGGPCLQCVFERVQSREYLHDTRIVGVDPTTAAMVSAVQAAEACKLILDKGYPPTILEVDTWRGEWRSEPIKSGERCPACVEGRRKFLSSHVIKTVTTLCGQDAVQISPHQRARLDLEAKAKELGIHGSVHRTGGILKLDLGDNVIYLFESGRALIKGTTDPQKAKRLYDQYIGL
jgi:adenylyltransferase/sulfurtransferase